MGVWLFLLACFLPQSFSSSSSFSSSTSMHESGVFPKMRTGVEYEAEVKEKQTAVGQKGAATTTKSSSEAQWRC